MERTGRVQSIDRAVQILNCFTEQRPELKLTEIAEELELNKSTVHGLINTLKYHGLIEQDEESQKYRLGLYLLQLAERAAGSIDVIGIARPHLVEICNKVDETIHIANLDGLEIVYIDKFESTHSMRIYTTRGSRNPAYCTGVGKAMLAFQDIDFLNKEIPIQMKKLTPNTLEYKGDLMKELEQIRKDGYALDREENVEGLFCVAVPIFDRLGQVHYGLSVSGPTVRMTEEKVQQTIHLLREAGAEISQKLGYRG